MYDLPGDEWKNGMTPDQKEPPNDDLTPLSGDDVRDHGTQLRMLYAQQRKSNKLPHTLIERLENRFVHTFCGPVNRTDKEKLC